MRRDHRGFSCRWWADRVAVRGEGRHGFRVGKLRAARAVPGWWLVGVLLAGILVDDSGPRRPEARHPGRHGSRPADLTDADTGAADRDAAIVIPLGIGLDYPVTRRVAVTADLILSLTALGERVTAGGREVDLRASVIPGFFREVRF